MATVTKSKIGSALPHSPQDDVSATFATTLAFDIEDGVTLSPPKYLPITITPALAMGLARAASVAASNSQDHPLSFSTLLVAMIVDENEWLKRHFENQGALFEEIAKHQPYSAESMRSMTPDRLASEYLTTTSARAALEEALRIARLASGSTTMDIRHLCAAYPVLPNWHLQDFQRFNIDRLEWARSFGAEMAHRFPDERPYWVSYADRASPVPLTSFSADVYTEDDLLGIDRSVDALALLIASTHTVTPLSIGVFGPWGSGKSFFMRHLQKRIVGLRHGEQKRLAAWTDKRARQTAKPEDAPIYFGEIAQVEFNAWHYNEGNLVASLVEHLFRNLRVLPNEGDRELVARRTEMLRQLKVFQSDLSTVNDTIEAAEQSVAVAKAGVAHASQAAEQAKNGVSEKAAEIKQQNETLATERSRLDDAIQALKVRPDEINPEAVIAVALGPLSPLLTKMRSALSEMRDSAFDWNALVERIFSTKGLLVVALCVISPLVLWLTKVLEAQWATYVGSIAAALGCLGSAIDVLKQQRARFETKFRELEAEEEARATKARADIQTRSEEITKKAKIKLDALEQSLDSQRKALSDREAKLSLAAQELANRVSEHDARVSERMEAEDKVREAEAELKRLSSALLLEEFIKDRLSTDEYRKQLGFLALVRRDIERLSQLIDQANKNWLRADNSDPPPLLNRIVLYIDDLDRCKESTVLAVLEAVHLLLAFPLFVCAVAVDPRWVENCLRSANRQFFEQPEHEGTSDNRQARDADRRKGDMAPATVGDYLEKIFQIPIWMAPIESRTRAALVNSLLGPTASPVTLGRRNGAAAASVQTTIHPGEASTTPDAFQMLVSKARERPDPLRISPEEAAFITEIADLLSDRPRALKRLVNIYRLLKASLPDIERATFVDASPSSAYRVCLIQLALFTSHPRLAPSLVEAVGRNAGDIESQLPGSFQATGMTLKEWFDALEQPRDSSLEAAFELIPNSKDLRLDSFRRWLPLTSRYLFHRLH